MALTAHIASRGPRHAAKTPPAPEATRDRMTATILLDDLAARGDAADLRPLRYLTRWWDGTGYVSCLVVRTARGRRRVVEVGGAAVVVPNRGRRARRALRQERAARGTVAVPDARTAPPVRRISQDVDVRTCPWPGCGHLAVIPAPGLDGEAHFPCGHDQSGL